ncbi:MAG: hypothetical protein A2487_12340 [Candidatus Raymondbacteria bacterium RifOxyC12_full_50_8]|uniref:Uncharacterized protein n=1 Tax=Candidatus Raymondbacteria bacterium RIFOXYD12_FULL_49_13 TaxID=1817890 RepID=A0A1F7FB78_UNCRA|nr:MAG: hypothetical protein A2248_02370 [Candidatus Raymondbacteria bacterium RIFOXYA2_FULL_49_16]OGJ99502.1 MAG: hypothetical protein A2487_12340 [Candidatus Raymondbacteria bacterium RifOxyC12_full_50_8]OGK03919.1 MAG: hypothetical protein A2519_19820 [Candidatus Raymondbacteria bacterium RIFOXYD12_FULL_49_13]OGP40232.1 MAG: hypothetical protein A2324_22780 [Candidatus Raymondbacteria bacterium RIFOXYB2_FULL_49_35]
MYKDEIIEEVRKNREAYAAKLGFDPDRIFADAVRQQKKRKGLVPAGSRGRGKVAHRRREVLSLA